MKTKTYKGKWRNAKAEQKFRVADEARWNRATSNLPEILEVPTRFGPTRVHRWQAANDGGANVVMLHGMGDTSIRWVPFATQLTDQNVYAIDTMGDPGGSVHEVGFQSADDYGTWLCDTIKSLDLDEPHLVGHSMGGYIALSYATQGGLASSLVLFEPVGVVKLKVMRFMGWNAMAVLGSLSPGPIRAWISRTLRHPVMNDKADARVLLQSQLGHPPSPPPLPIFTDAQLGSINAPVHVITGSKNSTFNVKNLIRRITEVVPNSHGEQIDDASHPLVSSHPQECLAAIRSALRSSPRLDS